MSLSLDQRINLTQTILNKFFPKLKMEAMRSKDDYALIWCPIHLSSYIRLTPGEINVRVIRIRLLDMLYGLKNKIELDIQEIEK